MRLQNLIVMCKKLNPVNSTVQSKAFASLKQHLGFNSGLESHRTFDDKENTSPNMCASVLANELEMEIQGLVESFESREKARTEM